jgi:hypothetical protein
MIYRFFIARILLALNQMETSDQIHQLLTDITPYLNLRDLVSLLCTTRLISQQAQSEDFWRRLVTDRYVDLASVKPSRLTWKRYYQELDWSFESAPKTDKFGRQIWTLRGVYHRLGDLPAVIGPGEAKSWFQYGVLHRDGDRPAVVDHQTQIYYQHGRIHRDHDQPAKITAYGELNWYCRGKLHRVGKPAVIGEKGIKYYFQNGRKVPAPN